ncbi:AZOBR_p60025 family cell surface glycopolymer formation protein [Leptospira ainlahdjerensis]|uniref:AZOBR_p60025 family cell surface glycopolymer formation protein n=1 Tax=Leptospira ainlahdjerensis TaxID=2810033 RepID=UPI0038CBFF85
MFARIRYQLESPKFVLPFFLILYILSSILIWKKYDWNPSSQINFGMQFVVQNPERTPKSAVIFQSQPGDLGAGYDGQIFYFYSRMLSEFNLEWPKGFEANIRALRIGYPLLISPFGWFGLWGNVAGMFLVNLILILSSWFLLRNLCGEKYRIGSSLYLFSPFLLGSYALLVSDATLASLLVFVYWLYKKEKWILFSFAGALAILTKEQALFLLFPLGLQSLLERKWKTSFWIASTLTLPILWAFFLKVQIPEWSPTRFADFFAPLDGFAGYWKEINEPSLFSFLHAPDFETKLTLFAKKFSRVPLFLLFLSGLFVLSSGDWRKGLGNRLSFFLVMFSIFSAGYIFYWSSYENVSRMFTVSIVFLIFWKLEDETISDRIYWIVSGCILFLFVFKLAFISRTLQYEIWK